MRTPSLFAGAVLALALCAPLSAQQSSVVSSSELDAALESRARNVEAERSAVVRVLSRSDVEEIARSNGFADRLDEARSMATHLDGEGLADAAFYARNIEMQLAGGQTITFSAITLIVILLLVVIIILIAD